MIHIINDPIHDPRWRDLVSRHPSASIFHTPGWLSALQQTYGYEPFVVTTSNGPTLEDGIVVCRVKGLLSHRLVSLPFSDHCDPLVSEGDDVSELVAPLVEEVRGRWRGSLELRPRSTVTAAVGTGLVPAQTYCLHHLDLRRDPAEIFRTFHPSSTQRAVRRAEREGVTYEVGRSEQLLTGFYRLLRMSRRRHGLPPQPITWFRTLMTSLGEQLTIHVASKDGQPIASILTLSFNQTVVYKYGGSDAAYHQLGGMPFLFWRVIQDAGPRGFADLDLGRSDLDQSGLLAFKDHLGATRSSLTYVSYPPALRDITDGWVSRVGRRVLARLPDSALDLAGRMIYRHLG